MKQERQAVLSEPIDFTLPFTSPMKVHKGAEPVTRDNFCSVIIKNFAVTATNLYKGALYFEWLRANCGFEYGKSIQDFLNAGGWNTFSTQEQTTFLKAFDSVKRHRQGRDPRLSAEVHENTAWELAAQLDAFTEDEPEYRQDIPKFIGAHGPLNQLSEENFLQKLRDWDTFSS